MSANPQGTRKARAQAPFASLEATLRREWLVTNGLGGFASSTITGCNTRRYHGLLIADPHAGTNLPPVGRRNLLSKLDETITRDGVIHELGTNLYQDVVHPRGHAYLAEFTTDPWPTWVFQVGAIRLSKEVLMPHGRNLTLIRYRVLDADGPVQLELSPLISGRDFHHTTSASHVTDAAVEIMAGRATMRLFDEPSTLWLLYGSAEVVPAAGDGGCWYYNFSYPREAERGLGHAEDLYCPFRLRRRMAPGDEIVITAACAPLEPPDFAAAADEQLLRQERLVESAGGDPDTRRLVLAADQFIINRRDGKSIIAGYPWFNDWGRDTMIALPGLTVANGRTDICADVLRTWFAHVRDGLIPNVFGDDGSAAYNTADATLWAFIAIRAYFDATGDRQFVATELYERMIECLDAHIEGTGHDVGMDPEDALLVAGTPRTQLTWMDAKVGDWTVTPRHGKPVEINALWYNALRIGRFFARLLRDETAAERLREVAGRAAASFRSVFYCPELGYCHDVLTPDGPDSSLRPNQLIACSLPYNLLDRPQIQSIVTVAEQALLTEYGMRTLSPLDSQYRGRYEGDVWERDGAYHQGTVWPWLIGPYLKAYRRAHGNSPAADEYIRVRLRPLLEHLAEHGSIPEIFDGDEPRLPRGCIAQAWSIAQVLECWIQTQPTDQEGH